MNEFDAIALTHSSSLLVKLPGVMTVGEWEETGLQGKRKLPFTLRLQKAIPTSKVPLETDWLLTIDFTVDHWGEVKIYPGLGSNVVTATFQHQQFNGDVHATLPCRRGNICTNTWLHGLSSSRNALYSEPVDTVNRVVWHIERCQEWIEAAAENRLAPANTPFELPDFKTSDAILPNVLAYYENSQSSEIWSKAHYAGIAELKNLSGTKTLLTTAFLKPNGRHEVYKPAWGTYVKLESTTAYGMWITLKEVPVVNRWQAPMTFCELSEACKYQNINLSAIITQLYESYAKISGQTQSSCLLLVGMPIPKVVDGEIQRYHWQCLELISSTDQQRIKSIQHYLSVRLKSKQLIPWLSQSQNWHPDDLLNRGRLTKELSEAKIALIGVGALGSVLADQLVRMGVRQLTLIDNDLMEGGNLVRHQLDLSHIDSSKALSLASKLNASNPSAEIVGIPKGLPSTDVAIKESLAEATLIIDTTADDNALKNILKVMSEREIPVVSCSLGMYANRLFFYADTGKDFTWAAFDQWFHPRREEEQKLINELDLPIGAGCWHPSIPARFNRISGLAGVAVEYIEQICSATSLLPVSVEHKWPDLTLAINES